MTSWTGKMVWTNSSRWLKILLCQMLIPIEKGLENPQDKRKGSKKLLIKSG